MDSWRPKLKAFYKALHDLGWDGLDSRPSLRGRAVDSGLLAEINDMLVDMWERGPQLAKPAARLWRLNCLMYCSAVLAVKTARHCAAVEAGECEPATSYDVEDGIEWSLTDRPPVADHPEKQAGSLLAVQQQKVKNLRRAGSPP